MKIGGLSDYWNPGYLRIGKTVKPEIVSPGQWFTAAAAINAPASRDTTGLYRQFNGTSAATPYTAGVVALLMQKNPDLTLGEIKTALQKSATPPSKRVDPRTCYAPPEPLLGLRQTRRHGGGVTAGRKAVSRKLAFRILGNRSPNSLAAKLAFDAPR